MNSQKSTKNVLILIPWDFSVLRYNSYVVRLNFILMRDCSLVKLEYGFVLVLFSFLFFSSLGPFLQFRESVM